MINVSFDITPQAILAGLNYYTSEGELTNKTEDGSTEVYSAEFGTLEVFIVFLRISIDFVNHKTRIQ